MYAVIFESLPSGDGGEEYRRIAQQIGEMEKDQEGLISRTTYEDVSGGGMRLSLSFWESEEAIEKWRNHALHRAAQTLGRETFYKHYRLRVAKVVRDYAMDDREEAPADSETFWAKHFLKFGAGGS